MIRDGLEIELVDVLLLLRRRGRGSGRHIAAGGTAGFEIEAVAR